MWRGRGGAPAGGSEVGAELRQQVEDLLQLGIAGLEVGGNVGQLWDDNYTEATLVAEDVIRLQEALTGEILDHDALIKGMVVAIDGDREHMCMGRSAPARLQRALVLAAGNNLSLPMLERISKL